MPRVPRVPRVPRADGPSLSAHALPGALALLAAGAAACAGGDRVTAPRTAPASAPFIASPALRAAVSDAELRVLPALDLAHRGAVADALTHLRAALDAGETAQVRRALARVRVEAVLPEAAVPDSAGAAAADLSALTLLVAAAEQEMHPPAAPPPAAP